MTGTIQVELEELRKARREAEERELEAEAARIVAGREAEAERGRQREAGLDRMAADVRLMERMREDHRALVARRARLLEELDAQINQTRARLLAKRQQVTATARSICPAVHSLTAHSARRLDSAQRGRLQAEFRSLCRDLRQRGVSLEILRSDEWHVGSARDAFLAGITDDNDEREEQ
jgi:hypothetical protein